MISKKDLIKSLEKGLAFLESMEYIDERGTGLFERWRINLNEKSQFIRPDCTAEYCILLINLLKNKIFPEYSIKKKCFELVKWCSNSVTVMGSPFAYNVKKKRWENDFWINDNSKVLIALINFNREFESSPLSIQIEDSIDKIANFILSAQEDDGSFKACYTQKGEWFPPFVTTTIWAAISLGYLYQYTGDSEYFKALKKALNWLFSRINIMGRMITTYEMYKGQPYRENWRPPSSESAEFIILASYVYKNFRLKGSIENLEQVFSWLFRQQASNGAVRNCDENSMDASEQNNPDLADLVYTNGYALIGGIMGFKATSSSKYLLFSKKLGTFLLRTQVREDVPWKGSWRGSYDIVKEMWAGRAVFGENEEEEGGMYSVYTGWTTAPILIGLVLLYQYID